MGSHALDAGGSDSDEIQVGYVPSLQLDHAHREKWAEREWKVHEIGRWSPQHSHTDRVVGSYYT